MGESGESAAIRLTDGDASGSSAAFEDASEEVLATEGEGAWNDDGTGGVPASTE